MKIAAYVNDQGQTLRVQKPGMLRLYAQENGVWSPVSETACDGINARSIPELATQTARFGDLLDGAEALLLRDVRGIAVTLLQNLGLRLWRLDGPPEPALDAVRQALEAPAREQPDPARFFERGAAEGEYRIDLAALLANDASLYSQLVLVPFLQQTPFSRLEVVCDHPPRWLDKQLPTAGFSWEESSEDGVCRLVIRPNGDSTDTELRSAAGCGRHGTWPKGESCSGGGCA
jgi:Fe-only nitrogenase accessory protein AnfO